MKVQPFFQVGDKVTLAPGCDNAFASVPRLKSRGRVYCVEDLHDGFEYHHSHHPNAPKQYLRLVGVRRDLRTSERAPYWPADVFRLAHRAGDQQPRKEAA